ncbi:hypothetical protein Tco_0521190 [Tanacetum coccineum]
MKLFKTLSLDESISSEYNLFSDLEENSEEEVAKTMAETMKQYMSKTRAEYGSGIARPKIDDKDHFELKRQFLKELRDNTFSGSDHEDANEHIKKVLEIADLFHVPNITQDQIMLQVKKKFLSKYCPPARTVKKMEEINNFQQEPEETLYQTWERFKELLMKQILDSKGAIPTKTTVDAKVAIQEMAKYSQKWHNGTIRTISTETSDGLAAIQAQRNNLGREIKKVNEKVYDAQVGCEQCKGPHYTKYCPLKEEDRTVKYPKGIAKNVLEGIGKFDFPIDFIILDMPKDVKVPLILERPFLFTAHTKIDVFKRKITLRVGDEKIIFKSMKPTSSMIKRVYMLSLRERMELDLEARLMGETLVLNRLLDPLYEDYIDLNDLNVPLELRRDKVDDLMPTIKEGEDKVEDKGKNVVGDFMNVPIFVEKFSVVTHFEVVEYMDGYRDQDMGDLIFEEPFCKASCVEARRFDGIITIHNGNDNVTYQMARSHPRFKHLSNIQYNKIKPLLKVGVHDKLNGTSHPYQKLKIFYKEVLNLGTEYIRDAKIKEWLTRGHISVHEIK